MTSDTTIHQHPDPSTTLLPLLHSHLPHSLPLLRRIQHNLLHPSETASTLCTFAPTPIPSATKEPNNNEEAFPWLAAHIDLFHGRETQITLYSSLEKANSSLTPLPPKTCSVIKFPSSISTLSNCPTNYKIRARTQLLSLLYYVRTRLLPVYLARHPEGVHNFHDPTKVPAAPLTAFLIGSIHTGILGLLVEDEDVAAAAVQRELVPVEGVKIHRVDAPLGKYIFRLEEEEDEENGNGVDERASSLPEDYRLTAFPNDRHSYDLVRSRTRIFRSDEILSKMNGVVIYHDGSGKDPVAWAFVSIDGSLATLQVEREHRGRGLAGLLVRETMRRAMTEGGYARVMGDGDGYWHADVEKGNLASRRVMEKGGGRLEWTVAWVAVEVF